MFLNKKIAVLPLLALLSLSVSAQSADWLATNQSSAISRTEQRNNRGLSNMKTHIVPKGQWVVGGSLTYSPKDADYIITEKNDMPEKKNLILLGSAEGLKNTFNLWKVEK